MGRPFVLVFQQDTITNTATNGYSTMKHKHISSFIAILFLLFTASSGMAQRMGVRGATAPASSTMLGLRGGLGIAGESIDPPFSDFTLATRTGFIGGGQLDYW